MSRSGSMGAFFGDCPKGLRASRSFGCTLFVGFGILTPALSGCTAIGYSVGAAIDSREEVTYRITAESEDEISATRLLAISTMSLRTTGGDSVQGELWEVTRTPTPEYRERYNQWRALRATEAVPPPLGDTVAIHMKASHRSKANGILAGFTRRMVLLQTAHVDSSQLLETAYKDIDTLIDGKGNRIPGTLLEEIATTGAIPTTTTLEVFADGSLMRIPLQDIAVLSYKQEPTTGRLVGVGVGLVLDAIIVYAIVGGIEWIKEF